MSKAKLPLEPMHGAALGVAAIGLSLSSFMQLLDQTIANVSIPTIAGNLGVTPQQGTWIVTSFAVSTAISLPLTGWLSQRLGQVRLLRWSTLLFVLASAICGLSTSLEMLVGARILQGFVAGPMMPLSQAMLIGIYPPERRVQAITLWAAVTIVAPILGPLIGGWISDNWGWPWIFFINVPIALLAAAITLRVFKGRETPRVRAPIDVTGLVLLTLWVGSMQVMLDIGAEENWFDSGRIVALAVVAAVGFCYFIVWELTEKHPVVDLRMFARRNFLVGVSASSLGYSIFFGTSLLVPLWLQTQMGYTAAWAGLAAAPIGVFPILLSRWVSRWLTNTDPRLFATAAFLALAGALFMRVGFTTQSDFAAVVNAQLMTSLGIAFFMVPLQSISLSGLRGHELADAAGLSSFVRVCCGSFGASVATTLWASREALHRTHLSEAISTWEPTATEAIGRLTERGAAEPQAYSLIERMVSSQSSTLGAIDYFWVAGWGLVVLALIIWFARPPFSASSAPVAE